MIHHQFRGKEASKIFKFILPTKNSECFINVPNSWKQPIFFVPNTYRLLQKEAGPCGLFAVLQSYILTTSKFNPDYSPNECLINAVIEIMLKLRQSFAFCTKFILDLDGKINSSNTSIDLEITNDSNEAKAFIESNNYFNMKDASFLLMISFAFLSGPKMLSSFSFRETFLTVDKMTDAHFVFLLLTGKPIDVPCDGCKILGGILCGGVRERQQIGFLSIFEDISEPIGDNFAYPDFDVWIFHYGGHFTSLTRENGVFYEYDTFLSSNKPRRKLTGKDAIWERLKKIPNV